MAVSEEKRVLTLRERAARGNSFGLEVKIERIPESAFRRRRKTGEDENRVQIMGIKMNSSINQ